MIYEAVTYSFFDENGIRCKRVNRQVTWQQNTGCIYVQVSRRIANTQKNNSYRIANTQKNNSCRIANSQKNNIIFTIYFIHTYCLSEIQIQWGREKKKTNISKLNLT